MRDWLEELMTVTDTSMGLQIKLLCIPLLPSLIVILGSFLLKSISAEGPYSMLTVPIRDAAFHMILASAFVALVGCARIFAKEYRRVHKCLFG